MSIVAVKIYKNKIVIGADSFVGFGYGSQLKDRNVKIFQHNDMTVGCVGYASDCTLFRLFTQNRQPKTATEDDIVEFFVEFIDWCKKKDGSYKCESSFIIVFHKKAFYIDAGFYIKEIKKYYSMGAGQDMAQTALMLGKDVKESIAVACEMSCCCEKPINLFTINL
jgi:ATP-dependent protease HslVU (ClpYQ) peptidase subunit